MTCLLFITLSLEATATNCLSILVMWMFETLVLLKELLMIGIYYRHF